MEELLANILSWFTVSLWNWLRKLFGGRQNTLAQTSNHANISADDLSLQRSASQQLDEPFPAKRHPPIWVWGAIVGYITMMIGLFIFFFLAGEDTSYPSVFLCGLPGLFSGLLGGLIGNNILGPGKRGSVVGGAVGGVVVLCVLLAFLRLLG